MTKKVLWSSLEIGSLEAAIDLEKGDQLLVRLTTQNLQEAIGARRNPRTSLPAGFFLAESGPSPTASSASSG